MAQNGTSGGQGALYFIVGILVAAVAVLGYLYLGGHFDGKKDVNIKIETPKDKAPKSGK